MGDDRKHKTTFRSVMGFIGTKMADPVHRLLDREDHHSKEFYGFQVKPLIGDKDVDFQVFEGKTCIVINVATF